MDDNPHSSFAQRVTKKSSLPIYLVQGKDSDGDACWSYIEIDQGKEKQFERIVSTGSRFTLTDYGRIITSGYGNTPPESTIRILQEENLIT